MDGGLAVIADKKIPDRSTPIVPSGAQSLRNMTTHCTACQLCVSTCPNGVLRPSTKLKNPDAAGGFLRTEGLPPGIHEVFGGLPCGGHPKNHGGGEVSHPDRSCRVGKGELHLANLRRGLQQLARHCPDMDDSLRIPVENTERCISCGACEKLYPARPFSTIYVEGHERHRII